MDYQVKVYERYGRWYWEVSDSKGTFLADSPFSYHNKESADQGVQDWIAAHKQRNKMGEQHGP